MPFAAIQRLPKIAYQAAPTPYPAAAAMKIASQLTLAKCMACPLGSIYAAKRLNCGCAGLPAIPPATSAIVRSIARGAESVEQHGSRRSQRHADALDLPIERDAGRLLYAPAHGLTQRLDVGRGRATEIDQEIAMHLRYLGIADLEPAAAGGVDQLPSLATGRILEGRAARAALDWLRRLARLGDLVHLGGNSGRIAGPAGEHRLGEDDVLRCAAMAIGVVHVSVGEDAQVAAPVDATCLDQCVLGLAAIRAAVHPQRPADRARDAAQEGEAADARFLGCARDPHIRHSGAGADAVSILDLDVAEAAAEPHDDARDAAVAHDQVGTEPNHGDRNIGGQTHQQIAEVRLVLGH